MCLPLQQRLVEAVLTFHVQEITRISRRLGLTRHTDAVKIERDLMKLLPREDWIVFSHRVIHHGRQICQARKPQCERCVFQDFCPRVGVPVKRATS